MIEIHRLSKRFRGSTGGKTFDVQALDGFNFTARDGQITGLLGPNGAGKTTALKILSGILHPDSGILLVDGLAPKAVGHRVRHKLGLLTEAGGLYPRLSARENIVYFGRLHGMSTEHASERAQQLAETLDMQTLLDRPVAGFSQGERMKTALARCLVHDPPNIVLDEPTNGLDITSTRLLRDALVRLRDEAGKCIVFSTHIMQEVTRLCDHVVVLHQGHTIAAGSVQDLKQRAGEQDFEEAFIRLVRSPQPSPSPP